MNHSRKVAGLACWIGLAALTAGCQTVAPGARRPSAEADPCAERLHDICGQLLLYHSFNNRFPKTLGELKPIDPQQSLPLVCPVSGKPYVYNPNGLRIPGRSGRLVLYDATASHSGMRWGILVGDPGGGGRLTARVILLSEELPSSAGGSERGHGQDVKAPDG